MVGCASQDVEQTILPVSKFKKRDKLTEILKVKVEFSLDSLVLLQGVPLPLEHVRYI